MGTTTACGVPDSDAVSASPVVEQTVARQTGAQPTVAEQTVVDPGSLVPRPVSPERAAELAAEGGLEPVNELEPLGRYLRQIWQRRHFLWSLASFRFSAANSQDRLGPLWNVVRPLLQAAVYATVFTLLFPGNARRIPNYAEYVTAGVFVYTFMSSGLISGASSVVGDLGLVRTIKFPRVVLPLATTAINLLAFIPSMAVLLVILLGFGQRPSVAWLTAVPAIALMAMFIAGAAMFCGRMTVIIRDFSQLLPFFLRLMFYLSGIVVAVNKLPVSANHVVVGAILTWEPFFVYMELVRNPLLTGQVATGGFWIAGALWAAVAVIGGLLFFWRGEREYGR